MSEANEIMQFLKDNPVFYLATVDGYLPRVRPLGFAMWYNGHLCIAIGKHKAAYKQLLDNTNLEICTANDRGEWLRVQGTANFDNTPEAVQAAFKVMPQLADMYNEETGLKLGIVYMDHLSAKLFSMSGVVKELMNY